MDGARGCQLAVLFPLSGVCVLSLYFLVVRARFRACAHVCVCLSALA